MAPTTSYLSIVAARTPFPRSYKAYANILPCVKIGSLLFRKPQGVMVIESSSRNPEILDDADGVRAKNSSEAGSFVPACLVSAPKSKCFAKCNGSYHERLRKSRVLKLLIPTTLFAMAEEALLMFFEV